MPNQYVYWGRWSLSSLFSIGFPAVIVVISLAVTQAVGYGTSETCWLDVPSGLIWAFIAPAIIIILVSKLVLLKKLDSICSVHVHPICEKSNVRSMRQRQNWALNWIEPITSLTTWPAERSNHYPGHGKTLLSWLFVGFNTHLPATHGLATMRQVAWLSG